MRRLPLLVAGLLLAACSSRSPAARPSTAPSRAPAPPGALEIRVEPNPIVAIPIDRTTYEFPFSIRIRETGGAVVTISRVGMDVFSVGGLRIYTSELGAAEIERRGYHRTLAAHGEVLYSWRPKQQVPDERLFSSTWGELWAEGTDGGGRAVTARTRVTVRRRDLPVRP